MNTKTDDVYTQTCSPAQFTTKPPSPPNFQQLYIDSLLRHIKSLEKTVASQRIQLTQLIDLVPKQPVPAAGPATPHAAAPAAGPAATPAAVHVEPPTPAHTPAPAPALAAPPAAALAVAAAPEAPATRTAAAARATTSAPAAVVPPVRTAATAAKPPRQKRIEIIGDSMLGGVRNWQKK